MNKEIKITPPEGYEIDKENSTFECIKFKPIENRWREDTDAILTGAYINNISMIINITDKALWLNNSNNYNLFATTKQAKSALAMARISQIMANDKRFGGVITDEDWDNDNILKYIIEKHSNRINKDSALLTYRFLAFYTDYQRDLFLEENEDLVKDYLMID